MYLTRLAKTLMMPMMHRIPGEGEAEELELNRDRDEDEGAGADEAVEGAEAEAVAVAVAAAMWPAPQTSGPRRSHDSAKTLIRRLARTIIGEISMRGKWRVGGWWLDDAHDNHAHDDKW